MPKRSTLRASDDDRERVADRLRQAAGEGRLLAEELEERLEGVFSARTYGQLSALVADLPVPRDSRRGHALPLWVRAGLAVTLVFGVLVAVAVAAALLVALMCLWVTWVVISWSAFGRRRNLPRVDHGRVLASAARHARTAAGAARGGRAAL